MVQPLGKQLGVGPYLGNFAGGLTQYLSREAQGGDLAKQNEWYNPGVLGGLGGMIGSYLGQGSDWRNTYGRLGAMAGGVGSALAGGSGYPSMWGQGGYLTSPQFMGQAGGLIGSMIDPDNPRMSTLYSTLGSTAGQLGSAWYNNAPVNWSGIGGSLGGLAGLLSKDPTTSGLLNIGGTLGGQFLGSALPSLVNSINAGAGLGQGLSDAFGSGVSSLAGGLGGGSSATTTSLGSALGTIGSVAGIAMGIANLAKNWDKMDSGQKVTSVIDTLGPTVLMATVGNIIPGVGIILAIGQQLVNAQRKAVSKGAQKLGAAVYDSENFRNYSQGVAAGNMMYGPGAIFATQGKLNAQKKRFERKLRNQIAAKNLRIQQEFIPESLWAEGVGGLNSDLTQQFVNTFSGKGKILAGARQQAADLYGTPEKMWAYAQQNLPSWLQSKGFQAGWRAGDPTIHMSNTWDELGSIEADEAAFQEADIQTNLFNYMGTRIFQELMNSGRIAKMPETAEEYAAAWQAWQQVPMDEFQSKEWWKGPSALTDEQFREAYGVSKSRWLWLARQVPGHGLVAAGGGSMPVGAQSGQPSPGPSAEPQMYNGQLGPNPQVAADAAAAAAKAQQEALAYQNSGGMF